MKIGAEDRRKAAMAGGLLLVAAVLVGRWVTAGFATSTTPGPNTGVPRSEERVWRLEHGPVDPTLRLGALRDTEARPYSGNGRDIFHILEERREIEPDPKDETKVPDPPEVVVVAPIPLSFFGFSRRSGVSTVFLLKGEDVFLAKEGDIVDRRYRIVRVTPGAVEIQDLLTERSEKLVLRRG